MATSTYFGWAEPDDTDLVKNGASAMRTLGNAIDNTVYTTNFYAGKNKIINGDFGINQRAFTSTTTTNVYGHDRWSGTFSDGTTTYSNQTFTAGAAPVSGYESRNYARLVTTGQTLTSAQSIFRQRIEDVTTFAGQTVTVSFWASAGSGTPSVAVEFIQSFGTGGSPSANVTGITATVAKQAITTSWARYSFTISIPSISGKTLGTDANTSFLQMGIWVSAGSDFNSRTGSLGIQSNTFNIWGVQVEKGTTATPFQTATGTIQGELAACQRYFIRYDKTVSAYQNLNYGMCSSTTKGETRMQFPTFMRTAPSMTMGTQTGWAVSDGTAYGVTTTIGAGTLDVAGAVLFFNTTGLTTGRACIVQRDNLAANTYVDLSAEL